MTEFHTLLQMEHCPKLDSADAFIAIYSIVSQRSFEQAAELCLKLESKFPDTPLLLLANCCDLNYAREVDIDEGSVFFSAKFLFSKLKRAFSLSLCFFLFFYLMRVWNACRHDCQATLKRRK